MSTEYKYNIGFISFDDFRVHVRNTIARYGSKLSPYDVKKFNSNIIDPVKMVFDKAVYGETWKELIISEIFRQRDKSNNNEIGYFHQRIFSYIKNCHVPPNGKEGGWDVIYDVPQGYKVAEGNVVHRIYVEMKNKHNTLNHDGAGKTYIKMQDQLLSDDDCACFLVEAIAKKSQNRVWGTTVNKRKVSHARIRKVSIDRFYEIVTGERDAFLKICLVLPFVVTDVLSESNDSIRAPKDTVYNELSSIAKKLRETDAGLSEDTSMLLSMYMLGFKNYTGFYNLFEPKPKKIVQ